MRYMLDTNICIYLMKENPPQVAARFAECYQGDVVMSSITLGELAYGVHYQKSVRRKNATALKSLLQAIPAAAFDENAAMQYGMIRAKAKQAGRKVNSLDELIAAHALSLDTTLVTNNEKDFMHVNGLNVENWLKKA